MNTKVNEGKLISGKEALIALANDQDVEYMDTSNTFKSLGWSNAFGLETNLFFSDRFKFRLKPRTITINGIEVPSIKKESAIYRSNDTVAIVCESFEEAELMCLALRQVFGGSHDN